SPEGEGAFRRRPPAQVVQVQLGGAGGTAAAPPARLYVGHNSPRLSVIDASSNLLLKHSEPLGQGRLTLFAVAKDESKVFAAWFGARELLVLNPFDLEIERQVALEAGGITSLAVNPQNGRLWVSTLAAESAESSVLHELDPAAQQVLRRVPLAQTASGLHFRRDGSLLYIPNRGGNVLSLFDPASGATIRSVRLAQWPTDMAESPDGESLYIVNLGADHLLEVDALTGEQRRTLEVGTGSRSVVAHPDGQRLFIVNQVLGYVQIIDLAAGQVADLIPVGRAPQSVTLTADAKGLYVANAGSASISLVDLEKKAVRETLNVGGTPSSLHLVRSPGR
ncbi:MAG: YncE family protein, partial [Chloroflexota bacterium]